MTKIVLPIENKNRKEEDRISKTQNLLGDWAVNKNQSWFCTLATCASALLIIPEPCSHSGLHRAVARCIWIYQFRVRFGSEVSCRQCGKADGYGGASKSCPSLYALGVCVCHGWNCSSGCSNKGTRRHVSPAHVTREWKTISGKT